MSNAEGATRPTAIVLDADGVIQRPRQDRRSLWARLLNGRDDLVDQFLRELFDNERVCYEGRGDFVAAVQGTMARWSCTGTVNDALAAWTAIDVNWDILRLITRVRASGVRCYLASNQEPYRCAYMSHTLGYEVLFDRSFYSCNMGSSKPDLAYFRAIVAALRVDPERVLFIDDTETNVQAATRVGLVGELFAPRAECTPLMEMLRMLQQYGLLAAPMTADTEISG